MLAIAFLLLTSTSIANSSVQSLRVQEVTVSIHNPRDVVINSLRIFGLSAGKKRCGGERANWAMITNHGYPINAMWKPSDRAPDGLAWVYFDRNGDGVSDGQVLAIPVSDNNEMGLPKQDVVYVTRPNGRDDLGLVYLYTVDVLGVSGVGAVPLVRPASKRDSPALGVTSCKTSHHAPTSGHLQVPAYSLAPVQ